MKNTFDLYRCSPLLWAGLEYEDALDFRIEKAAQAKIYYREEARKVMSKDDKEYTKLVDLYADSDDAIKWNRKFIEEIEEERRKINGTQCGKRQKKRSLPGERDEGISVRYNISPKRISVSPWQWLTNRIKG